MTPPLEKRMLWAGILIALGLGVQLTLTWSLHPLAFIAFVAFAVPLVAAGVLLFLWTLASS
jgi:hypothetical protein